MFDQLTIENILFLAGCFSAFMIGRSSSIRVDVDFIIECTIDHLRKNNFLKWRRNDDGEIELLKLDE